ncbi:2,3-bisphosphoglycerate-independent phosphoglycerate mutase [Patescibacteria group bacterium]|nr:2,3-bisphosphoglycerate-independent phosphoglycerate mutase [Patescibacteria group bacterium]MBU1870837.1 2,3-bisphosphoglycerate-independent phosphoglycerate mutase [Patescibacteria group bacterium]
MIKIENKKSILPMILIILDGWGITKPGLGNATTLAKTPTINGLTKKFPSTALFAHGKHVGLSSEQPGNSEAGHMNIGAGRIIKQDSVIINNSINDGTFFKNPAFIEVIKHIKNNKSKLHLMGLISNCASAHSDPKHLLALLTLIEKYQVKEVYLHLFTDGRDSPKYSSLKLIQEIKKILKNNECIATVMGRFYAMDRKKKWERTEKAYEALVNGIGKQANSVEAAITENYNCKRSDEFIEPYIICKNGKITPRISDNDGIIFFNLRSDRARQLTKIFVQREFCELNKICFNRKKFLKNVCFVAMTDFGPDLGSILTAYPSSDIKKTLPMILKKLKQLYLAETEKYAHVTYFFNGGYSNAVDDEVRMVLPSPDVGSYKKTPIMSSDKLTKQIIMNLIGKKDKNQNNWQYDFTLLNFAAPDMIGHTGDLSAGINCCHQVDKYLDQIVRAYLKVNGTVLITADHGNIEEMINPKTGEINTEHSVNQVPFIIVNKQLKNKIKLRSNGILADIAPTILELLSLKQPKEMRGKSLIK